MQMKSVLKVSKIATPIMLVCGLLAVSSVARADDQDTSDHGRSCSNRTLHGDYGFTIEGLLGVPGPGLQLRGVVMEHYDGNGHLTALDHVVVNGMPPPVAWRPGSGTYVVNPDCTGRATINIPSSGAPPLKLHFVLAKQGREIRQVVDGNAVIATGSKVE